MASAVPSLVRPKGWRPGDTPRPEPDLYDGTTSLVDDMQLERHARVRLADRDDIHRQRIVVRDVARRLARRGLIATDALLVVQAQDTFQGFLEKRHAEQAALMVERLQGFQEDFGHRALVAVTGVDHRGGYTMGSPDVVATYAAMMRRDDTPFTCLMGNGQAPLPALGEVQEGFDADQALLLQPPVRYELSTGSRWGSVLIKDLRRLPAQAPIV